MCTQMLSWVHHTKNKISYMSCLPKHDISYIYLAEDRVEFNEISALSYRFPILYYIMYKIQWSSSRQKCPEDD